MTQSKLVPVEPTREMIKAGAEAYSFDESNIYRAMLAVAPSPWVSVGERLPEDSDGEVLALMDDGSCEIAWASYWSGARADFAGWMFRDPDEERSPTHWMPLPTPPEKSE